MPEHGIRPGVMRLFRLATGRRQATRDVDDEIRFHLEERTRQLMLRGHDESSARAEAARRFGDVDAARARLLDSATRRDARMARRNYLRDGAQDMRLAMRSLRRSPGFLLLAVCCLGLGIGANASIFSVVDAVLLEPLPFHEPSRLVRVWESSAMPPGVFDIVTNESRTYAALGGVEAGRQVSMTGVGEPVRVVASQATDGFFAVLGEHPMLGRTFRPGEHAPTAPAVAVLSHALWQSRFGGDAGVIGGIITLDGVPHEIIGVMPQRFAFPSPHVQVWTPARFVPGSASYWWTTYLMAIGRLQPTATLEQATAEAAVVLDGARAAFPMRMPDEWGTNVRVVPLQDSMVGASRQTMLLLFGAVGLVLLIACVNVAGLYMSRATARAREMAVRTALGAGRGRLVRLLLVESLMVSLLGTVAGLAVALVGTRTLVSVLPADTPRINEITLDVRVVLFSLALMLLSALVFGLLPALRATGGAMMQGLRTDERTGDSRRAKRGGATLAVAQVALAVTLVTGAGLLIKSLWQMGQVDLGFRTKGLYTAQVPLPSFASDTAARASVFYARVLDELRAMPDVRAAALASSAPFGDGPQYAAMEVETHPTPPGGEPPVPHVVAISGGYFETLAIPLVQGRGIGPADRANTERVAVIDEVAARTLWPEGNAIGKRIRYVWNNDWITVVGIVGSVKRDSMSGAREPALYVPAAQGGVRAMRVIADVDGNEVQATNVIREAVARVDRNVPVSEVRALETLVSGSAAKSRFATALLSIFAAVALLLGAVGIYGVLSASVARRTREFGVRMALGASRAEVLRLVLMQGAVIMAAGVSLGAIGGLLASRALRGLLFDVSATDGTVIVLVIAVLAVVTLISAVLPARRAIRVDPLTAIRSE